MKLIFVILLLTAVASGQAVYTATTSGNWRTPAIYTHTGTPCNSAGWPVYNGDTSNTVGTTCGDTLIINTGVTLTVPSGEIDSIGNSPITSGVFLTNNVTANSPSTGLATYTGTITGGGAGCASATYVVTGYSGTATGNNGSFTCSSATATSITLNNASAVTVTTQNGQIAETGVLVANGTGSLTVNGTFVYAGRVQFTSGTVTLGPGSTLQYDSSYATANAGIVNYSWDCTAINCSASSFTWAINGTSASHATIEGDSFKAPHPNTVNCSAVNQCLAGSFNYTASGNAFSTSNQGAGTIHYLDIKDVQGALINAANTAAGRAAWITSVFNIASAFDHITVTNSGTLTLIETQNASAGLTVNGLAITNSVYTATPTGTNPSSYGCLDVRAYSTTTATFLISNTYADCIVNQLATSAVYSVWLWRNILMYRSPAGTNPGQYVGLTNGSGVSSADSFDEFFSYPATYASTLNTNSRPTFPMGPTVNSIWFSPKTSTAGQHIQVFTGSLWNVTSTQGQNFSVTNNIWGGAGANASGGPGTIISTGIAGGTPSNPITINVSGNIILCDQFGQSALGTPYGRWTGAINPTTSRTLTVNWFNNISCSTTTSLTTSGNWQTNGALGFEGNVTQAGIVATANSNLFWNPLNLAVCEVCDSPGTNFAPPNNQPVLLLTNNAVGNTNTSLPAIGDTGGTASTGDPKWWVTTGPQNDITMLNHLPLMVDRTRTVMTFDYYLVPSGLLGGTSGQSPLTYWQSQGATQWAASTNYAPGALVYDQQTGLYNGLTTFWRCINPANCNSGTNGFTRPATGVDTGNLGSDYNQYWEPAYMQYFRQQIYLGTVFSEGAVPVFTDINGNQEPMHMIGLLNAWIRQGHKSLEPTLWRGCLNGAECGNSYAVIQHIFPPAVTN